MLSILVFFFKSSHSPGVGLPVQGPSSGESGSRGWRGGEGGLGPLEMAAPGRGGVKWIFQTPRPSPTLHLLIQSPPLSQSRPGSAKCDLAPLIAGGGCGAGAAVLVLLEKPGWCAGGREDPPPQAPTSLRAWPMRVGRARPCPTHTQRQTRRGRWGPRGFLATLLAPGNTLGPRDPLCCCPSRPARPHRMCSRLPHQADFPLWGLLSRNQAQAHSPCPRLQPPPTPVGYPWKTWVCSHLSSSQWR